MKHLIRPLAFSFLLSASHLIAADRPPNFIFILSDDIAQGDIGVYGQE